MTAVEIRRSHYRIFRARGWSAPMAWFWARLYARDNLTPTTEGTAP